MEYPAGMLAAFAAADAAIVAYDAYVFGAVGRSFSGDQADALAAAAVEALQAAVDAAYRAPDQQYYAPKLAEFMNIAGV